MEIGIRELKDRLSEILHRANAGERITITHHGRPLCEISPTELVQVKLPANLIKAIEEGWLTPAASPTSHAMKSFKPIKPKKAGKSTTELLRESRAERF